MWTAARRGTKGSMSGLSSRIALFVAILAPLGLPGSEADVDFARDIRPILSEKCFRCHGPDEETRASGLRLDEYAGAIEERGGKTAIAPGAPTASEMIARIKMDDPARRMPLGGDRLADEQIKLLEEWISDGATYERHWAYEKPVRPPLPPVSDAGWVRDPIDHFILNKLDVAELKPSGAAEPAVLMRRLYLDLIGIPPSPEQIDDFLASPTDGAYRDKVEELLASPQYGEHWARHWLDLARYARLQRVSAR